MTVAVHALAMGEETLGHEQVEFVPGARHGDIKKTPLLLDFGVRACGEIRRDASSTTFSTKDRPPFPTLGRMRGRENEIILIQKGNPGVIAGHIEWIEHLRSAARRGLKSCGQPAARGRCCWIADGGKIVLSSPP